MEASQPPQPTVVVVRFQRLDAQGRCDDNKADRPLLGTDWRLPGARPGSPATLRFDGGRVTGSDGCNRVMGPVVVAGSQLRFGPLAGTRMACSSGQAEADAFGAALLRVQRHRIRGDVLELQDEEGTALLRLQATP
jgi:heat shock protein HslJ